MFAFVKKANSQGELPDGYSFPQLQDPVEKEVLIDNVLPVPELPQHCVDFTETKKRANNATINKVIKEEVIQHCLENGKKNTINV